jgi:SAM-dependent methyltransferase
MNIVGFFKESVKVLAFEEQKFAKFWMMFLGMWHALINKRGSLQVQVFQNNLGQQAYIQNKPVNLPNFFIVGAAKAGTSSIGEYLSRHPEIYISPIKEPHFFSEDIRMADFRPDYRERATLDVPAYLLNHPLPNKHIAYIEDQSQYLELFREVEKEQAIGELSTGYLYSNSAAENLFKFKPDAKIVMVLRQPVERAYSHYLMNLRDLWDHDSGFINALERDFTASEKGWGRSHLYVELGLYFEQVSRYLKCFPGNQVKIVLYEDFKNDPVGFIKELCEFLGVSSSALIAKDMEERKNIATLPRFKILNMYLPILNKCRRYFGMFLPDKAKDQIRSAMFSTKNIPKLQGVDFDTEAAKNANLHFGIKVYSRQLKDINYPDDYFDAITMNHVIEHIFDPVSLMQECQRILKPTGCLVVITPNIKSYGHSYFNSDWMALDPPRHVFIFSSPSLKRLADKVGFDDVDVFTTPVNAEGVFRGSLSIRKVGSYDMQEKSSFLSAFEKLKAVLMQFNEALRNKFAPEIGEEVVMICRNGRNS